MKGIKEDSKKRKRKGRKKRDLNGRNVKYKKG
jgi:hypothetical protein